jgi:hypothetical protein
MEAREMPKLFCGSCGHRLLVDQADFPEWPETARCINRPCADSGKTYKYPRIVHSLEPVDG